ncbi:YciI family protein [Paenibacillus sp. NPDC056579]|uniref:YciI family protein n=1 Tax=Paenibacillus sp. NPDC056579 TaxID=3345871 RepID=UPI0036C57ADF
MFPGVTRTGGLRLLSGGPFSNHTGGMIIIDTDDEAELKTIISKDPTVVNLLLIPTVYPWQPVVSNS